MRPTGPSSPTSLPSYRSCAARMVRRELKPSFLAASCWIVLVVNGAAGFFRRLRFSTLVTTNGVVRTASTTACASSAEWSWGLCPSTLASDASKVCPSLAQQRLDAPVLLRREGADVALALDDQPEGDGLHPAGREAGLDAAPEDRARLVADQPVEDPAGLLGVHLAVVDRARLLHRLVDRVLGDLVEQDAVGRHLDAELVGDVPGDGLALAIGVGREVDGRRGLCRLLELGERLGLALDGDVLGLEVVLDVDAELPGGEIAQVADRGPHVVARRRGTSRSSWPWWATPRSPGRVPRPRTAAFSALPAPALARVRGAFAALLGAAGASAGLPVLEGDFADRLDLVAMITLCLLESSPGQFGGCKKTRAASGSQGGGLEVLAL